MSEGTSEAKTVKDSKKTVRAKKYLSKSFLFSPLKLKWPQIDSAKQELILKKLKTCLMQKNLKSSILEIPSKEERKKVFRPLNMINLSDEDKNIRSQVVMGISEVTRLAQKDGLRMIIVDRSSPWQLHRHLIQMAATHRCLAAALDNLSDSIASMLSLQRISAIAFKKTNQIDSNYFDNFFEEFNTHVPPIDIPFLSTKCDRQFTIEKSRKLNDNLSKFLSKKKIKNLNKEKNMETTVPAIDISLNLSTQESSYSNQSSDSATLKNNASKSSTDYYHSEDAAIKFVPDDICFLKKRKIDDEKLVTRFIDNSSLSFIKLNNEENDLLFLRNPVFKPKKTNAAEFKLQENPVKNVSSYIKSDVKKISFSKKQRKNL